MEQHLTLQGIVLSATPVGEYDKRLVILTRQRGKIVAFARGARRPKSQLLAAAAPFAFGNFSVYEGRDAYTLKSAEIDTFFTEVTGDYEKVWSGYYFLEVADYFSVENEDEGERIALLYMTLRALAADRVPMALVKLIYEFKTFVVNGDYPNIFSCVGCGKKEDLTHFSMERRGCLCQSCAGGECAVPVSGSALYTLQFIASAPASKLYSFKLTDAVMDEVARIITMYRRRFVHHDFRSEEFLDKSM